MMVNPLAAFVIGGAIAWLLDDKYKKGDESMYDNHNLISGFHDNHVFMDDSRQKQLRANRNANRDRVKAGLEKNDAPSPMRFVRQGSYAMRTIVQHPENDYDIDDGVAFKKDDLVGSQGAEKSALDARKMVLDALGKDVRFSKDPELKPNCIRIHYAAGYHIDMPVYRICKNANDDEYLELAGSNWRESDPEGVTSWFDEAANDRSPDAKKGGQLRRIVRLMKVFAKTVSSTKAPSGLIISVLAIDHDCYFENGSRDDVSLYETMRLFYDRLVWDLSVYHPKTGECLTEGNVEAQMKALRDRLKVALEELQILFDDDCTNANARKAWKKVFKHEYFDEEETEDSTEESVAQKAPYIVISNPSKPWGN